MKLLPAGFALVLIAMLVLVWQMRKTPTSADPPAPAAGAAPAAAQPKAPGPTPTVQAAAGAPVKAVPPGEEGDHTDVKPYPVDNVPPKDPPPNLTPAEQAQKQKEAEEWLKKNKKPDLTGEEKVERAAAGLKNLQLGVTDLEKQIADAEKSGRTEEAAEKKIRLQRLRSRLDAIGKAVADKRDPSGGVDELAR